MPTKTLYHSALVKMGPVQVTVKSDIQQSKFAGKPDYVTLTIAGEDRNYNIESPECATVFDGQKGSTFSIVAEGSGKTGDAIINYVGEPGTQTPRPQQRRTAPVTRPSGNRPPQNKPAASANPPQQPNRPPQPAQPPQQQRQAAPPQRNPATTGDVGARVGMAIGRAVEFSSRAGEEWNPAIIYERASDLIRLSMVLEKGNLAPLFSERQQANAGATQG